MSNWLMWAWAVTLSGVLVGIWGGDGTHLGSVFARDNVAEEEPKADYQDACKEAIDYSYVLYIVGFHLYIKLLPIDFLFV